MPVSQPTATHIQIPPTMPCDKRLIIPGPFIILLHVLDETPKARVTAKSYISGIKSKQNTMRIEKWRE